MENNYGVGTQLKLALERLTIHDHLCLIYETQAEQFAALVPFISIGLERGEQCVYIADDNTAQIVLEALQAGGIDTDAAIRSGALAIISKREAYLKQGYFDPDWMIRFLIETTEAAKAAGFSALRATGEMTWALGSDVGVERLIEYEAKLNRFFPQYDALAICQYNRARFSPEIICDVIRTHPLVICGGMVCHNFYYVPPDEFLKPNQPSLEAERLLNNIQERERVERGTQEAERKYRAIFENAILGIVQTTLDGRFIAANPALARMLGYESPAELMTCVTDIAGQMYSDPDARAKFVALLQQTGAAEGYETQVRRKDGSLMWVSLNARIIRLADGASPYIEAMVADITGRKRAEEVQQKSLQELNAFFSQTIDGCFFMMLDEPVRWNDTVDKEQVLDYVFAHQRITQVNDAMLAQYGATREQMLNLTPNDLFEHNLTHGKDLWRRFFDAGKIRLESDERKMDGTPMWIEGEYIALYDSEGRITGHFGIQRDITERKRAEAALSEREKHSEALLRLSRNLERAQTYDEILNAASDEVRNIIGYQNLWAYLLTEDKKYFKALIARGAMSDTVMSETGTATLTIAGDRMLEEIAEAKAIVVVEDARTDERTDKEIVARLGNRTLVNVPITLFDKHLGSVGTGTFGDEGVRVPTKSEQEFLTALASHMAVALDRLHLLDQRKRTEEALRRSEAELKEAQRVGRLGSWDWDAATDTITWSEEYYHIYGFDPKQRPPGYEEHLKAYTVESAARLDAAVKHSMETGEGYQLDLQKDHGGGWITARGEVKLDTTGQIVGLRGTAQDITERKRAEREIAERTRLLEAIFTNHLTCLVLLDRDFNFIRVNEAYARACARDVSEFPGHNHFEFYPSDAQVLFEDVVRTKKPFQVSARPFVYTDHPEWGTTYWDWTLVPLLDRAGEVEFLVFSLNDVSERVRAEEALRQRLGELEALHTVSAALRTAQTRDEALPILLDETLSALETDTGIIRLYHPESDELRAAVARGWFQHLSETSIKPGEGIAGKVFRSGQSYVSTEFRSDPLTAATVREQVPPEWGGVCLPISSGTVTVGVLFVSLPFPNQITTEQVKLLESLAEMGGSALQRMSLHEETVRQLGQLQALHRIDQAISASTDLRMTLSILLEYVATQLKVDATDVLLLNPHTLTLEHAAGRGFRTRAVERARIRLGESFAGRAALERRAVQLDNLAQVQESPQFAALWASEGFAAYYTMPLIAKGQVKGVLEVFHRTPMVVGRDWVSFLDTLAGQAAIAIDNAQLYDHLQRSNVDLALAYDATIEGWSRALDLRDKETEGHTQRVTEITIRLAKAMGIGDTELLHIRRGALLHDIGKMGVPDSILHKPGPLTKDEWALMRLHPQFAFDMLAPIIYLRPALEIPYCHHEKWDGTGYPRGLKGEQIPLAARLFAVVDVWDALRSNRPYRESWPEEKVLEHIRSFAGTHFDPKAVELFLSIVSERA